MSKKQKIKDQIKSLKDLIADLELSLIEEEDVGKTSDSEDILCKIKELEKQGGPYPAPYNYPKQRFNCVNCGQMTYAGEWHQCQKTTPWANNGYQCQCGQWVGSMQVHTCRWSPGITCITYG